MAGNLSDAILASFSDYRSAIASRMLPLPSQAPLAAAEVANQADLGPLASALAHPTTPSGVLEMAEGPPAVAACPPSVLVYEPSCAELIEGMEVKARRWGCGVWIGDWTGIWLAVGGRRRVGTGVRG